MTERTLANRTNRQRGYSLLEVLIAILVVSIGLLGLAGLQFVNLRNTHSSTMRTVATQLAYDMADRVRANPRGLDGGHYNNPAAVQSVGCLGVAGCTPQQMAQMDMFLWQGELSALLPLGAGVLCVDGTPNDGTPTGPNCDNAVNAPYVVKVWWDDTRSGAPGQRFVVSFRP